jgi:3-hydroxyisobutyrate dehydrogenase-like beta-hydroxyacid dehydrogenase
MKIAFIGLGEAASAFISGWGAKHADAIRAFDIKSLDDETAPVITSRAQGLGVTATATPDAALQGADLIFSTVTADQAVKVAEAYAPFLQKDALWCDLNSCAPHSKRQACTAIENAGGRYLDVAVMAPVHPKRNMVPCLISGAPANTAKPILDALPMSTTISGPDVGRASAIKLVRSIMVKGLEALTAECALAAAAAGVADDVFPSLKDGHPKIDVPARAAYNLERMTVHGVRRAAEMEECAAMLAHLGLPNDMASGTVRWQTAIASAGLDLSDDSAPNWDWFADRLLPRLIDASDRSD